MNLDVELLARLNGGDDPGEVMQNYLDYKGDDDYVTNLQHLCEMAGWPDENIRPYFAVESAVIIGNECRIKVNAHFDEKVHGGGCPDMPTIAHRYGQAEFSVDLRTGNVQWRAQY